MPRLVRAVATLALIAIAFPAQAQSERLARRAVREAIDFIFKVESAAYWYLILGQ